MPYVAKPLRDLAGPEIESLVFDLVENRDLVSRTQITAAVLVEIVSKAMRPATGWRYHNLHRAYGVFMAAATEANRRLEGPQLHMDVPEAYLTLVFFADDIEKLVAWVRMEDDEKHDGYLNFIVSEIAGQAMPNNYVANTLLLAGENFYKTQVATYEDAAIAKNGDIKAYA